MQGSQKIRVLGWGEHVLDGVGQQIWHGHGVYRDAVFEALDFLLAVAFPRMLWSWHSHKIKPQPSGDVYQYHENNKQYEISGMPDLFRIISGIEHSAVPASLGRQGNILDSQSEQRGQENSLSARTTMGKIL